MKKVENEQKQKQNPKPKTKKNQRKGECIILNVTLPPHQFDHFLFKKEI